MILVIGAGITGLSFANSINDNVLLVDADSKVGGYCQTTIRNGYVWDRAGHFFHFSNDNVKSYFHRHIDQSTMIEVEKKTAIYIDKDFIDFPFQKNIHQLPKEKYINCLIDLYHAQLSNQNAKTFKDFVLNRVGKSIADEFLIPYNEKLYACDLDTLDKDAMGRFFPEATFEDILLNARVTNNDSYNQFFSYPKHGAQVFISLLEESVRAKHDIQLDTRVVSIDVENKNAILQNGQKVSYDVLINTSPLDSFLNMIGYSYCPEDIIGNKVIVFNLGFDSKTDLDKHWIYYPGNEVFYRVGCYHNIFGSARSSLYVEIGFQTHEPVDESILLEKVLEDLKRVGLINDSMRLVDYEFVIMNPAYAHINEKSESLKHEVKSWLSDRNIYTAGRYGDWKYCSIEDNILEAVDLSKRVADRHEIYEWQDFLSE